jgi:hypothetical protein
MLTPEWRKSSYSNGQSNCVKVRLGTPNTVAVRDSKHPAGPNLAVTAIVCQSSPAPSSTVTLTCDSGHPPF